jgi:hypothetical protein
VYAAISWNDGLPQIISVRGPKGKSPRVRFRRTWKDNVKLYLKQGAYEYVSWYYLNERKVQYRVLMNTVT